MPFKKGQSGNASGREKGSKNERTKEWEALGEAITGKLAEKYQELVLGFMESGDPDLEERGCQLYLQSVEYFKPKQARVTHAGDKEEPVIVQILGNL